VIGVHTIEGLGLAADPVQKKLIPTVMPALHADREMSSFARPNGRGRPFPHGSR
jgi:hypothetical protein